jgi:hypothetical protein
MSATAIAGTLKRECHCQKHGGLLYLQMFLPNLHPDPQLCWIGQCSQCVEDDNLERRAQAILGTRGAEVRRRIGERYNPDGQQIKAETDAAIEAAAQRLVDEVEAQRPNFEADVRRRHREKAEQEVETEMLAEIISELKGKDNA